MNILEKITQAKMEYLTERKKAIPIEYLKETAKAYVSPPSFKEALKKPGLSIIGEIKKASPSKGIIDHEFDYMGIAREYNGCVDAISVLTEEAYFLGKPEFIVEIRGAVDIPILRKDFIIDSYQIFESKTLGASAILLIASLLDSSKLKSFIELSFALGMDSLVEIHNETELYRGIRAGAEIIGINNRNLNDFSVDIKTTEKLGALIPKDVLCVSESGIISKDDAEYIKTTCADAVLVGESFMRSSNKTRFAEVLKNA